MRVAIYLDTDTQGDDLQDDVGNNITAGWYVYDWPLGVNGSDPTHGPYETEEQAMAAENSDSR